MRIGLLGGTFNPVHIGHLLLAEGAKEALSLDHVLWIPSQFPPHKPVEGGASPEDRSRMVELAIEGNPSFTLSRIEMERPPPSYTVDTVRQLKAQATYGKAELYFLIGSDTAQELGSWKEINQLMKWIRFVAVPRPGEPDRVLPSNVTSLKVETIAVSASDIRRRVREGRSIRYLVPEPVRRYIQMKGLYR